jgi:hypothetical protein
MFDHWSTKEELRKLRRAETIRVKAQDDESDPICECGQPAYACICEQLAMALGYWADGAEYMENM